MNARVLTQWAVLVTLSLALPTTARADEASRLRQIHADSFAGTKLSSAWEVHEGKWSVSEGTLVCQEGGLISLKTPPGGRFVMEFEIAFPSNWMSVIPFFSSPTDYGTLYFGGGYWESFEILGTELADYVQHKDEEIVRTGGFQKIRVVADYGLISFTYDGKKKGPAVLPFRPGARVAFRSLPNSGLLKIRKFRIQRLEPDTAKTSVPLPPAVLASGRMHADHGLDEKQVPPQKLAVDAKSTTCTLDYNFSRDPDFQSRFVRIPVNVGQTGMILLDLHGDNSGNSVFVIVHDSSGEQHLAMMTRLGWAGWQDVGINLKPLLTSPKHLQRESLRWGGDRNQRIDFPITAIDLGIVKRDGRTRDRGTLQFRNLRFEK